MTNLSTLWQQTSQALSSEHFERAFELLERGFRSARSQERARIALWAAELHGLYGETGAEDGLHYLHMALDQDPAIGQDPLYRALHAELASYLPEQGSGFQPREAALEVLQAVSDTPARFHAACALLNLGALPEALGALEKLDWQSLDPYLRWRYFSWLGGALEQSNRLEDAATAYGRAADLAPGVQRASMLQEQAAVLLSLEQASVASELLDRAWLLYYGNEDAYHLANWHYLKAQALLALGRPEEAAAQITTADDLEGSIEESSYGVQLVYGQTLMALGQPAEAAERFARAVRLASSVDRPYALHELGVAHLDADAPVEAREALLQALQDDEYPFLAEVYADLAEAEYRLGRLAEAEASATYALNQGATVAASLILGAVAFDYYHLGEALEHYTRVAEHAAPGSREWITAQQMLADVLAQDGFRDPARILEHAQAALEHTDAQDEWYTTLQGYVDRAMELLRAPGKRTLN
ncbi:tetratricopeptide (TPR) repeat protein [Deinobacterium chartae]|uniref:Tetratricopeptide (TPR) repeat protein n=1 Tax=Deinobacterium chartae TaxID=521158 RepID=A0A841I3I8_9DEIO|nr:tetratricopeptide repeat protein [Deinobacterium chartae]MBB6099606.1 tetratricopeptide (TPR) repeat protein [Deinobacterium chartae]